ncbi:glycoside hydrolase family 36 protein [Salinibacterium sp. TMP30]|uniref:glycoside hydrolase family 36 protein n=1 Tax=Salinibacterium sp. TMP30 TaxID=3138237 RepID=UPI00313A09AB
MTTFRPDRPGPASGFQGEGLLALTVHGEHHIFSAPDPRVNCPSIRLEVEAGALVVTADGEVEHNVDQKGGSLESALARWADQLAAKLAVSFAAEYPTVWCPWYQYFTELTESDMYENIDAIDAHNLPIEVIGVDDAFQKEIGDWTTLSSRFSSLPDLVKRIHASNRRAGVWIAPFWVGARSELFEKHPEWLLHDGEGELVWAGNNWDQDLFSLDVSHPGAKSYLVDVFQTWRGHGFDYFKLDFLFAGLLPGQRHQQINEYEHYQLAVSTIREAVGSDATLLGCGAPLLPSVGLFDGMRVSCDIDTRFTHSSGDISQPSQSGAILSGRSRAFMHGRFWHNDPDCLIVRPGVEHREQWASHIAEFSGVRASSDRIAALDDWGMRVTRELLVTSTGAPLISSEESIR